MKTILIIGITFYRCLSPALHFVSHCVGLSCQCKFPVSCSEYALEELKSNQNLFSSVWKIFRRLWICSPWGFYFFKSAREGR